MNPQDLEKFIHQQLRSLPSRRAPRSLESRVMAAIEQGAMAPSPSKSWNQWPAAVRISLLALSTCVAASVVAAVWLSSSGVEVGTVASRLGAMLGFFAKSYHAAVWSLDFIAGLFQNISPLWLQIGMALIVVLYASFFGLSAAVYRTLYRNNWKPIANEI